MTTVEEARPPGGFVRATAWARERRGSVGFRVAGWAACLLAFMAFVDAMWGPDDGTYFQGASVGALYGLIGIGIILIYRTNRIVNFAAAGLGAVPSITMAILMYQKGLSWWIAFPTAMVWAVLLGALVDVAVIRRFDKAPRLILTVATIGISQILAYIALLIPPWLGNESVNVSFVTPFTSGTFKLGTTIFTGDYIFGLAAIFVAAAGLTAFLRYTRIGIALRASAENADRAALLGIPVRRVQTVAWVLASLLAALALFVRSGLVGVPVDGSLGPKVMLFALAAAVIARMENMPRCVIAGMGLGVMGQASVVHEGNDSFVAGLMVVVILLALLLQRRLMARALDAGVSTWQSIREFRAVPAELARVREVVLARTVLVLVAVGTLLALPYLVGPGRVGYLIVSVLAAIVAVSLVVLSGWAGQISLGQFGMVGVGALVAGKLAGVYNVDFFAVMLAGIFAGALVSVLLGIPALRIPGLYLAVATLAFAGAMQLVVLDRHFRIGELVMPPRGNQIELPVLWGRIVLRDEFGASRPYYYLCLAFLLLAVLVARSYRRTRAGRAVVAIRENSRAASSYSINEARTKLAAFAISGGIAAMAGVLTAYNSGSIDATSYGITKSLTIFSITAIGGLTSLGGAVFGALLLQGIGLYGEDYVKNISLLVTGPGLLLILLFLPGGLAEGFYAIRDRWLRRLAHKYDIHVPSLVADRRQEEAFERTAVSSAEERVEAADTFDVLHDRRVVCPVCHETLSAEEAPDHEHLRVGAGL